jgi:hypothetical protein
MLWHLPPYWHWYNNTRCPENNDQIVKMLLWESVQATRVRFSPRKTEILNVIFKVGVVGSAHWYAHALNWATWETSRSVDSCHLHGLQDLLTLPPRTSSSGGMQSLSDVCSYDVPEAVDCLRLLRTSKISKWILLKLWFKCVVWIGLVMDRFQWRDFVRMVINLRVLKRRQFIEQLSN